MDTTIRLRTGVVVRLLATGVRLLSRSGAQHLGALTAAQEKTLAALATDCHEADLLDTPRFAEVHALLTSLRQGNWIAVTVVREGVPLITIHPTGARTAGNLTALLAAAADRPAVLSRFAVVRRDGAQLLLESPRSGFTVHLHDPSVLRLDDPDVRAALAACDLTAADEEPGEWTPHELWFHSRSRQGRHELAWGATNRGVAPPARRHGGDGHALPRPSHPCPVRLQEALDERRSVREHDDAVPLTVAQLGEFLFRAARTTKQWTSHGTELLLRPYPSAGALHELEIYPVVTTVTGLSPGLYRYDSHDHQLVPVGADPALVAVLARQAAASARMAALPQVLFVITARFDRLMWKYESMAYALTLKNVGALMSVMYLVATAMRLAPCALGGGDAEVFARAAGLDQENESSVGEFVLGSAPPSRKERT